MDINDKFDKFNYYDFCLFMVYTYEWAIFFIPDDFKDFKLYALSLYESRTKSIYYIPDKVLTKMFYINLISSDVNIVHCLPKEYLFDNDLMNTAIRNKLSNHIGESILEYRRRYKTFK